MADRRKRRKNSGGIYKVIAGVVGVSLIGLLVLIGIYFISNLNLGIGTKTPGIIEEVSLLPTYDAAVTPSEWATLEANVPKEITQNVRIMMIGDMLMHLNVTESGFVGDGTKNYDHLFERILPDIQEADIRIVNEEIVFAGEDMGFSGYPMFNTADWSFRRLCGAIQSDKYSKIETKK